MVPNWVLAPLGLTWIAKRQRKKTCSGCSARTPGVLRCGGVGCTCWKCRRRAGRGAILVASSGGRHRPLSACSEKPFLRHRSSRHAVPSVGLNLMSSARVTVGTGKTITGQAGCSVGGFVTTYDCSSGTARRMVGCGAKSSRLTCQFTIPESPTEAEAKYVIQHVVTVCEECGVVFEITANCYGGCNCPPF